MPTNEWSRGPSAVGSTEWGGKGTFDLEGTCWNPGAGTGRLYAYRWIQYAEQGRKWCNRRAYTDCVAVAELDEVWLMLRACSLTLVLASSMEVLIPAALDLERVKVRLDADLGWPVRRILAA